MYETRNLDYAPVISSQSGSFTTVSGTGTYKVKGGEVFIAKSEITITNAGTAGGYLQHTLPFTSLQVHYLIGRDDAVTGSVTLGRISNTTNYVQISKYDFTTIIATGRIIKSTGFFNI